jgi:hypothetical protein
MKIPRDVSGTHLVDVLCRRWRYTKVHQVGSHIILETSDRNPLLFQNNRDWQPLFHFPITLSVTSVLPGSPLEDTLIPVLALLSNYDRENCLINVGTEGRARTVAPRGCGKTTPPGPRLARARRGPDCRFTGSTLGGRVGFGAVGLFIGHRWHKTVSHSTGIYPSIHCPAASYFREYSRSCVRIGVPPGDVPCLHRRFHLPRLGLCGEHTRSRLPRIIPEGRLRAGRRWPCDLHSIHRQIRSFPRRGR